MKTKIFLLSVLLSGATFFTFAQDDAARKPGKREFNKEQMLARIDSVRVMRTAAIVEKAGLTEIETAQFLPLYQEFQTKIRENRRSSRQAIREARKNKTAIDYVKANSDFVNMRVKEAEIFSEFSVKLSQVLPAEKVWKVLTDRQFKQKAMRKGGKKMAVCSGKHQKCSKQTQQ